MPKFDQRNILAVRNSKIRSEFEKLYKTGLRADVVVGQLSNQFFLSRLTVEAIVYNRGVYREF
ncbi:MAG: hypothetical protein ABIN80_20440 [Dyadobacter sp.]|uniref:hypothetical protein n=1 Tax=Dyadobacter sp. TaxID=1914288 RepID=UPI003267CFE0